MKLFRPFFAISSLTIKTMQTLEVWRLRDKSSMEFSGIEAHMLQDIGISEAQRFIGVNKEFWEN
jgi:uncharacterized protein YjiS (DUF1127 family)